jgi:hypothetical protein
VIAVVVVLVLVVLFVATWSVRRHGESDGAHESWHATDERFVDPSTGRTMQVYLDGDGGRHYVPTRAERRRRAGPTPLRGRPPPPGRSRGR